MVNGRRPRVIRTQGFGHGTPEPAAEETVEAETAVEPDVVTGPIETGPVRVSPGAKVSMLPLPGVVNALRKEPVQEPAKEPVKAAAPPRPGATVLAFPEPPARRRRRRALIGVAGVVVVVAIVMALAMFSPVLAVKTITVDGNKLATEKSLQSVLSPLLNKPLPQVTLADVEALLKPVPQVKSVTMEARPPSTLLVHMVERVPVALLKNGNGYLLVDQDGVQLGTTKDPAKVPLPLIDGGTAAIGKATFHAMTAVLATLPKSVLSQLANASAKSPDAVQLKLNDGKTIIWGNASDMELKAQVLDALINAPAPTPVAGQPDPPPVNVYDVSAPRHPVTR
jgi:cell division protein FtsQ